MQVMSACPPGPFASAATHGPQSCHRVLHAGGHLLEFSVHLARSNWDKGEPNPHATSGARSCGQMPPENEGSRADSPRASVSVWCTARSAECRPACHLGPLAADLGPPRDQGLAGASHPAQFRYGLPLGHVLLALPLGRAERDPSHPGQQVGAVTGDLAQLRRAGRLPVLGQGTPAGLPPGRARQLGHNQPVTVRSAGALVPSCQNRTCVR